MLCIPRISCILYVYIMFVTLFTPLYFVFILFLFNSLYSIYTTRHIFLLATFLLCGHWSILIKRNSGTDRISVVAISSYLYDLLQLYAESVPFPWAVQFSFMFCYFFSVLNFYCVNFSLLPGNKCILFYSIKKLTIPPLLIS